MAALPAGYLPPGAVVLGAAPGVAIAVPMAPGAVPIAVGINPNPFGVVRKSYFSTLPPKPHPPPPTAKQN